MRWVFLFCFGTFICTGSFSQSVVGEVFDNLGEPVAFLSVKIVPGEFKSSTNERGIFQIDSIAAGEYKISITGLGYQSLEQGIQVVEGRNELKFIIEPDDLVLKDVVIDYSSGNRKLPDTTSLEVVTLDLSEVKDEVSSALEVLDRATGIRVRQSGGLGSLNQIQLNGLSGRAVRQYYDGIPLQYLGGGFTLNTLPVLMISNIDIYKGVMPVDIGTDALGGGINIVPDQPKESSVDVAYEYGSFNTHRLGFTAVKASDTTKWFTGITGFYNYSDNNYKMEAPIRVDFTTVQIKEVERFHSMHNSVLGMLFFGFKNKKWTDFFKVNLAAHYRYDEFQHGARVTYTPAGEANKTEYGFTPSLRYKKSFGNGKFKLDYFASYSLSHNQIDDSTRHRYSWDGTYELGGINRNSEILGNPSYRKGLNNSFANRLTFNYQISKKHNFTLSEFYAYKNIKGEDELAKRIGKDSIDPNTMPSLLNKNILGVSLNSKILNSKLETLVFAKHYAYSNTASEFNKRSGNIIPETTISGNDIGYGLGLKYIIRKNLYVKSSFERALRIPDEIEVFGDYLNIAPNFGIAPETSNNLNFGARYNFSFSKQKSKVDLNFNTFFRWQENLIRLRAGRNENDPAQFVNEEKVNGQGVELGANYDYKSAFKISANLTWQKSLIGGEPTVGNTNFVGTQVPNLPTFFYNLGVRYKTKSPFFSEHDFSVYTYYNYVKSFSLLLEGDITNEENLIPTQNKVDAGFTYFLYDLNLSISMQVANVFNARIYDNYRLPKPGRAIYFKIRYYI